MATIIIYFLYVFPSAQFLCFYTCLGSWEHVSFTQLSKFIQSASKSYGYAQFVFVDDVDMHVINTAILVRYIVWNEK